MICVTDTVVKAAFKRRIKQVKEAILSGEITFYNVPLVECYSWPEKLLNVTALNCTLLLLAERAKWN